MFPACNARYFICVEIFGRRRTGHIGVLDFALAIDRHKRIPPGQLSAHTRLYKLSAENLFKGES